MNKILRILDLYFVKYRNYRRLLKNLESEEPIDDRVLDGVYLFNTVRSITTVMHVELFLAFSLAKRGERCLVLLDDGALHHWDSIHDINNTGALTPLKSNIFRRFYTEFNRKVICYLYSHPNIEYVFLGNLIKGLKEENVVVSEHYELIKACARSSCRRYSSSTKFWVDYEGQDYYKMSYDNGIKFALAAHILQKRYKIKKLITSHGIYSCWGVLFEIFKKSGIDCLMYSELIYNPQHALLCDVPHQKLSHSNDWSNCIESTDTDLSVYEVDRVIDFFEKRLIYRGADANYYFDQDLLVCPEISGGDKGVVFGLFPNVVWDGDFEEVHRAFTGILNWVKETISILKDTDHTLVIRCHPAEDKFHGDSPKLESMLRDSLDGLNELKNIVILSSDLKLDVYKFIQDQIDIGLVYDGMLGLEMSYLGIPVITAGNGRYAGSDFSEEPKDFNEYSDLLKNPALFISNFQGEKKVKFKKLLRFAHWYLYEKAFFIPILDKDDFFGIDLKNIKRETFSSKNDAFKRTLDYITSE